MSPTTKDTPEFLTGANGLHKHEDTVHTTDLHDAALIANAAVNIKEM
jgi:hypothetical protein